MSETFTKSFDYFVPQGYDAELVSYHDTRDFRVVADKTSEVDDKVKHSCTISWEVEDCTPLLDKPSVWTLLDTTPYSLGVSGDQVDYNRETGEIDRLCLRPRSLDRTLYDLIQSKGIRINQLWLNDDGDEESTPDGDYIRGLEFYGISNYGGSFEVTRPESVVSLFCMRSSDAAWYPNVTRLICEELEPDFTLPRIEYLSIYDAVANDLDTRNFPGLKSINLRVTFSNKPSRLKKLVLEDSSVESIEWPGGRLTDLSAVEDRDGYLTRFKNSSIFGKLDLTEVCRLGISEVYTMTERGDRVEFRIKETRIKNPRTGNYR